MLESIWSKKNTHLFLVELKTYTTTKEVNIVVPQKAGNSSTSRYRYTTLEHVPQRHFILLQRHLTIFIYALVKIVMHWKKTICIYR